MNGRRPAILTHLILHISLILIFIILGDHRVILRSQRTIGGIEGGQQWPPIALLKLAIAVVLGSCNNPIRSVAIYAELQVEILPAWRQGLQLRGLSLDYLSVQGWDDRYLIVEAIDDVLDLLAVLLQGLT